MTLNYYINKDSTRVYVYNVEQDMYSDYDIHKTPSGYYCDTHKGKPNDEFLVKSNITDPHDLYIYQFDGVRENHDDYWWDYGVGTYVKSPNDDRIAIGTNHIMVYRYFKPRYRVYKYRGDHYIWCCDERLIRRVHCEDHKLYIDGEFQPEEKYWSALDVDWEFLAEFNYWHDCFYCHRVKFKSAKEIHSGIEYNVVRV